MNVILIGGEKHGQMIRVYAGQHEANFPKSDPIPYDPINIESLDFHQVVTSEEYVRQEVHLAFKRSRDTGEFAGEVFFRHRLMTEDDALAALWELMWERVFDGAKPLAEFG